MATFRNELKHMCYMRDMNFLELGHKLSVSPALISRMGQTKRISFATLNQIIKLLNATEKEKQILRHICKFSTDRKPLIIDDEFINAIEAEAVLQGYSITDNKRICKIILNFAGIKSKIK